jgi:uncharacterized protein (DUF433 family)
MSWDGCPFIEADLEKVGGAPVIQGTRIPADAVLIDEEYGRTPEQTHASFPVLPIQTILEIRAWAHEDDPQLTLDGTA